MESPPSAGVQPIRTGIQSGPIDFSTSISYAHLRNKAILITGGASGIGAALAREVAQHGACVIVGDINAVRGTRVVAELRQRFGAHANATANDAVRHHFVRVDVSQWDSQVALFRAAARCSPSGRLHAVVAAAGINDSSESEALELLVGAPRYHASSSAAPPPAPRLRTLDVDLTGTLYTTTLALSYLRAGASVTTTNTNTNSNSNSNSNSPGGKTSSSTSTPALTSASASASASAPASPKEDNDAPTTAQVQDEDAHLLLVSSIAGLQPVPGSAVYAAAKAGVIGLFRSLRLSAPVVHGVRVNLLVPGYVPTPMHGVRGAGALWGVPKTTMADVVGAALRVLADPSIVGRGVGADARAEADLLDQVAEQDGLGHGDAHATTDPTGALWDVYAHDFEQSDRLIRRTMTLLNILGAVRSWVDTLQDGYFLLLSIFTALCAGVRRLLQRRPA